MSYRSTASVLVPLTWVFEHRRARLGDVGPCLALQDTAQSRDVGLREFVLGGFQAPFLPAVPPQAALKFSYRSDKVTRD